MAKNEKLDCGCEIISYEKNDYDNDICRYTKFCESCKAESDAKVLELTETKNKIINEFRTNPTNDLVNEYFETQTQIIRKDENMTCNMYYSASIHCLCCDKKLLFGNLHKHVSAIIHTKKLPQKDVELLKKMQETSSTYYKEQKESKQKKTIANECLQLCRGGKMTKEEFDSKMKEIGLPLRLKSKD